MIIYNQIFVMFSHTQKMIILPLGAITTAIIDTHTQWMTIIWFSSIIIIELMGNKNWWLEILMDHHFANQNSNAVCKKNIFPFYMMKTMISNNNNMFLQWDIIFAISTLPPSSWRKKKLSISNNVCFSSLSHCMIQRIQWIIKTTTIDSWRIYDLDTQTERYSEIIIEKIWIIKSNQDTEFESSYRILLKFMAIKLVIEN